MKACFKKFADFDEICISLFRLVLRSRFFTKFILFFVLSLKNSCKLAMKVVQPNIYFEFRKATLWLCQCARYPKKENCFSDLFYWVCALVKQMSPHFSNLGAKNGWVLGFRVDSLIRSYFVASLDITMLESTHFKNG